MKIPTQSQPLTIERLERALVALAYFMELDGPVHAPLFEKLEAELESMRRNGSTAQRAKQLLASYKDQGAMKAIC